MKRKHMQAVETYFNGNISDFKRYIKGLSAYEAIECLDVFMFYGGKFERYSQLLEPETEGVRS